MPLPNQTQTLREENKDLYKLGIVRDLSTNRSSSSYSITGSQFYGVQKQKLNNSLLRDGSAQSLHMYLLFQKQYYHSFVCICIQKHEFPDPFSRLFCSTSFGK